MKKSGTSHPKMGYANIGYYKGRYIFDELGKKTPIYYSDGLPMIRGTCTICENYEKIYTKREIDDYEQQT